MINDLLLNIIFVCFWIRVVANVLNATWLWQLKGYRADRLLVHLRDTKEGRRYLINPKTILFTILLFLVPLEFFESSMLWYQIAVAGVFLWDIKDIAANLRRKFMRKPTFTLRVGGMGIVIFAILVVLLLTLPLPPAGLLVVADRLVFPLVALSIAVTAIPIFFAKRSLLYLATQKRRSMKDLIVIGVTGSYGKSSTKDHIADFLSDRYSVLKTARTNNTEIAIARLINNQLTNDHEVLVLEIGAYKTGHIAEVCSMAAPTIGVITGVNEQHLALFGGIENTKRAKMELIDSLPQDGTAYFNGDDPIALQLSKYSNIETHVYSQKQLPPDIKKKDNPFYSNVAVALMLAEKLGVDKNKIVKRLASIAGVIGPAVVTRGDITILDDSQNSNPRGFAAALDLLAPIEGRKILITPGIIELGSQSNRIHRELGEKIGTVCDYVLLVNDNFLEPIRAGLGKTRFDMKNLLVLKREELAKTVGSYIKGKSVVLLEGRIPMEIHTLLSF